MARKYFNSVSGELLPQRRITFIIPCSVINIWKIHIYSNKLKLFLIFNVVSTTKRNHNQCLPHHLNGQQ